jgi:F0F1-type ATP synthase assembly protein I
VEPHRSDGNRQALGDGHNMNAVAITAGLVVVLCVLGGFWADRRLATTPLFTLVGMVVGTVWAGFWGWHRSGLAKPRGPRDGDE